MVLGSTAFAATAHAAPLGTSAQHEVVLADRVHPAAPAVPSYTVRPGDTLSGIALERCGSAADWPRLWAANRNRIPDPNLIYAGDRVHLACHAKPVPTFTPVSDDADVPAPPVPTFTPKVQQAAVGTGSLAGLASELNGLGYDGAGLAATAGFLRAHGYSAAGAAGVDGCIAGESAGNPESVGSGGGGLIGWTPITSASPAEPIVTGNAAADLQAQLTDLLAYDNANGSVAQLNAEPTPLAAADFYSSQFERPAVQYSDVRFAVAEAVFTALGG